MVCEDLEYKVRLIIKTFLIANKGKTYTSKEIAYFINSNNFGLGKYTVNGPSISRWLTGQKHSHFFKGLNCKRKPGRNVWEFWYSESA